METTDINISAAQECKRRVKAIKGDLPRNWRTILFQHNPEYNLNDKNRKFVENVFILKGSSLRLTEILERIAARELKLEKQAA